MESVPFRQRVGTNFCGSYLDPASGIRLERDMGLSSTEFPTRETRTLHVIASARLTFSSLVRGQPDGALQVISRISLSSRRDTAERTGVNYA